MEEKLNAEILTVGDDVGQSASMAVWETVHREVLFQSLPRRVTAPWDRRSLSGEEKKRPNCSDQPSFSPVGVVA
jgi:hypothetical protein